MTEPDLDQLIAQVTVDAPELLTTARRERARLQAAGVDTARLDQVLGQLEALTDQTRHLDFFRELQIVFDQHGIGPYSVENVAASAAATVDLARRVLDHLVAEGLAGPGGEPQNPLA